MLNLKKKFLDLFKTPLSIEDLRHIAHFHLLRNGNITSYTYHYKDGVGYESPRVICGGLPAAFARLGEEMRKATDGFKAMTPIITNLGNKFAEFANATQTNGVGLAQRPPD